jgi:phenylalanyl-tRNA synthetase alpha subunit
MEIIMTQMRKFEQEAVATEIYEKIQETHGSIQEELENTKDYKALQSIVDELSTLEKQSNELHKTIRKTKDSLGESINKFNEKRNKNNFNLCYTGYDSVHLYWNTNEWNVKRDIERKLAIALISPDWKDKLSSIIDEVASQFGA